MITEKKTKIKKPVTADSVRQAVADQFWYMNKAVQEIYKNKKIPAAEKNTYMLAKWSKGWNDLANVWHQHGPTDFKTSLPTGTPGTAEILRPFEKLTGKWYDKTRTNDVRNFENYRVAERMLEKEAQGVRTTNDPEALKMAREIVDSGRSKYAKASKQMTDYHNDGLKFLRDSGKLSDESYQNIMKSNESYTFFQRVFDEKETAHSLPSNNPISTMKGIAKDAEPSKILAPTISEMRRMRAIIRIGERERVLQSLRQLAVDDVEGKWVKDVTNTATAKERAALSNKDIFNEISAAEHLIEQEDNPTAENISQVNKPKLFDDKERLVLSDNGAPVYLRVHPDLKEAIEQLDNNYQLTHPVAKMAVKIGQITREGIISNPVYPLVNGFKDMFHATAFSRNGYNPLLHGVSAFMDTFSRNEKFIQYVRDKAPSGSIFPHVEDFYDAEGKYMYDHSILDRTWNMVKTPFDLMKRFNTAIEHTPRYAEYTLAKEKGKTGMQAALDAKDVGVDFSMHGASDFMTAWRKLTPFMGAQVSATEQLYRESTESSTERRVAIAAKAAGTISVLAVGALLYRRSDPALQAMYDHSSEYDKNTKFGFPIPNWQPMTLQDSNAPDYMKRQNKQTGAWEVNHGGVMWLPKPQELGFLFGTLAERVFDGFLNDHPTEHASIESLLWDTFAPNMVPPAAENTLELGMMAMTDSAKDIKTGNPIVPDSMLRELPADRYTPATSKVAIELSKAASMIKGAAHWDFIAPANIDAIINKWTGGMGTLATQIMDLGLKTPANEGYERPEGDAFFNSVLVKRFYKKFPYPNPSDLRSIYDESKFIDQEYTSYKNRLKADDPAGADALEAQYGPLTGRLSGYTHAISNIQNTIKGVLVDKNMKAYEKRQLIDSYLYDMTGVADDAIKYIKDNHDEVELLKKQMVGRK